MAGPSRPSTGVTGVHVQGWELRNGSWMSSASGSLSRRSECGSRVRKAGPALGPETLPAAERGRGFSGSTEAPQGAAPWSPCPLSPTPAFWRVPRWPFTSSCRPEPAQSRGEQLEAWSSRKCQLPAVSAGRAHAWPVLALFPVTGVQDTPWSWSPAHFFAGTILEVGVWLGVCSSFAA